MHSAANMRYDHASAGMVFISEMTEVLARKWSLAACLLKLLEPSVAANNKLYAYYFSYAGYKKHNQMIFKLNFSS